MWTAFYDINIIRNTVVLLSYVRWARANVVEDLVSRWNRTGAFVRRYVDRVIVREKDPAWRANPE